MEFYVEDEREQEEVRGVRSTPYLYAMLGVSILGVWSCLPLGLMLVARGVFVSGLFVTAVGIFALYSARRFWRRVRETRGKEHP